MGCNQAALPIVISKENSMTDVYQRLAAHLDRLPAGFPATESGVELRILKRLFTPEEAEIAQGLTLTPEPAEEIARRLERDPAGLDPELERMSRKGLIFRTPRGGRLHYMAAQFVIGIWEYHVNDLSEELIRDVNEYIPHLMRKAWLGRDTKQLRVIPVSQSVSAEMAVMPYDQAEAIIRRQSKIVVSPCICRREHQMMGKGCGKPLEVCLSFGAGAHFYEENGLGRAISQEEAVGLLQVGLEAGLVLQPGNAQKPANICMCCGCCCQILKNLNALEQPARAVAANYFAAVDAERCTACGSCADRCQMRAITVAESARIDRERCIGCGLCVTACDFQALSLLPKPEEDRYVPPVNLFQTYLKMARERGLA
jgi:ferredoxin